MSPDPALDFDRFRPLLRLHARRLQLDPRVKARFDESDVVQETLLRAFARRDQRAGTTDAQVWAWLLAIMGNVFRDMLRRVKAVKQSPNRERCLAAVGDDSSAGLGRVLADPHTSPSGRAARQEDLFRLAAAVEELPPDQRDAFIAHHLLGQPVGEIARRTGRTEKSVAGLLLRGRLQLRKHLSPDPDGGDP
jgi:RNA polymerase sigma-70 factor (ECF subfamily)